MTVVLQYMRNISYYKYNSLETFFFESQTYETYKTMKKLISIIAPSVILEMRASLIDALCRTPKCIRWSACC